MGDHMTKRRLIVAITAMLLLAMGMSRYTTLPLSAAVTHNRLATNRLATNRLATNRLATNRLATNALSSTRLEATEAASELLSTAEGRDLFSYLMGCALPPGTAIEATIPGAADTGAPDSNYTCSAERCTFEGSLGLAPDWIEHKLSSKEERWVSACILTRVNIHNTTEAISLRGPHPGLAVGEGETELFTLEEGAFFGNIFTHEDDPIEAYACVGQGGAQAPDSGGLALRDCAEEDPNNPGFTKCGFTYVGICRNYDPLLPQPYACKNFDGDQGTFSECYEESRDGRWPGLRTHREVITVYVSGP
jgi:hypothetical protein